MRNLTLILGAVFLFSSCVSPNENNKELVTLELVTERDQILPDTDYLLIANEFAQNHKPHYMLEVKDELGFEILEPVYRELNNRRTLPEGFEFDFNLWRLVDFEQTFTFKLTNISPEFGKARLLVCFTRNIEILDNGMLDWHSSTTKLERGEVYEFTIQKR